MIRTWLIVLMCTFATVTIAADDSASPSAAAAPAKGKMLVGADGVRLGIVGRVTPDGGVQIILDGKLITVPATTLSNVDGKLTTTLSKSAVLALR